MRCTVPLRPASFLLLFLFIYYRFISIGENTRLTWIQLTNHSSYYTIARTDDVTTFFCVNPPMNVHDLMAMRTRSASRIVWPPIVAHNRALMVNRAAIDMVTRMIAILPPLTGLNDNWLLSELHSSSDSFPEFRALCNSASRSLIRIPIPSL